MLNSKYFKEFQFLNAFLFLSVCPFKKYVLIRIYTALSSINTTTPALYNLVVFLTLVMTLISISLLFATLTINVKKAGDRHPVPVVPRSLLYFCTRYLVRGTCASLIKAEAVYGICEDEQSTESMDKSNNAVVSR